MTQLHSIFVEVFFSKAIGFVSISVLLESILQLSSFLSVNEIDSKPL